MASLKRDDFFGSRFRCLTLTGLPDDDVAAFLTRIIEPYGTVSPGRDIWKPGGPRDPDEVQLDKVQLGTSPGLLTPQQRAALKTWWLQHRRRAKTPTWDIVSTCEIGRERGLVLVEAKAHPSELNPNGKLLSPAQQQNQHSIENHEHIGPAIAVANAGLVAATGHSGWQLARDSHYQLSNRFAWAWKIASLGCPVVLVYLGFLNAVDMANYGAVFQTAADWHTCVLSHAAGIVPPDIWGTRFRVYGTRVNGTPMCVAFRSLELTFC